VTLTERTLALPFGPAARLFEGGEPGATPLVYLHPAAGISAEDPFANRLAEHHRVIAPLAPGFADIAELDDVRDIWELGQWYDDLFEALGLERAAVIGHSFGGMVAAELAAQHPARVGKLILVAPVGLWSDDHPVVDLFATPALELMDLVWGDPTSDMAQAAKASMPMAAPADGSEAAAPNLDDQAVIEQLVAMTQGFTAVAKFMMPLPDKGLSRRLYRVRARTLVVWGAKDRLTPPEYADDFGRLIAGSRVEVLDDAGHMVTLERSDDVSGLVRDFVAG
jgi:pimeloyl-ACP methyl ester carboxylesterase